METTHKGFEIKYDEKANEWYFHNQEGTRFARPSLKALKGFIDRMKKKAFKRVEVYVKKYNDEGFKRAVLTCINERGRYRVEYPGGGWESEWRAPVLVTPANTKKIEKINLLQKEKNKIENQIDKIEESTEKYKKPI